MGNEHQGPLGRFYELGVEMTYIISIDFYWLELGDIMHLTERKAGKRSFLECSGKGETKLMTC